MLSNEPVHVPYGCTVHGEEEVAAVVSVLKTSTQMGKHVREMERKIAALFQKKHGIMVNSGSSANYLAVEILNLPQNSEVITPILTFATTVAPLVKNHLIPAFVDVEENTFNINVAQVEEMISCNTRAMLIPNLLGNLPDWSQLRNIANKHNLFVIEDSADTLGATFNGRSTGYYSDISTTSFYGSHVINCAGNGGMLSVNNEAFSNKARLLRSWGRSSSLYIESEAIENRFNVQLDNTPYDAKFIFESIGYNFEPSEMGAAFGLVQLNKLADNIKLRNKLFQEHLAFFGHYKEWFVLPQQSPSSYTGWLAFPLIVRDNAPFTRTQMQIFLEKQHIQTRTILTGNILKQPGFSNINRKESAHGYPHADHVTKGGILLGCHHGMDARMMNHIHETFENFVKKCLA